MATTKIEQVPVSSIVLNVENYRHGPVATPEEALRGLLVTEGARAELLALATDIAARGLDPSSLPIVEPVDGYWRVLEGNRRMAALKLMANPDLIPTDLPATTSRQIEAYRKKFVQLKGVARLPRTVLCVVTDDRELTDHLVRLKHTGPGAHKGAGTMIWDTEGRTRFELATSGQGAGGNAQPTAANRQAANALALLDALAVHFSGDDDVQNLIDGARQRGLTTLGRVLLRSENQLRLGVSIESGVVRFLVERDPLRRTVVRLLSDLGTPRLNSRTTNKAAQVGEYLDSAAADLPTAAERLDAPQAPTDPGTSSTSATTRPRRRQQAPMRRAFANLNLYHASDKTRSVLGEMKRLVIDDNPYILSALNRMLIDLYTADVLRALRKSAIDSPSKRTRHCLELIDGRDTKSKDRMFPRIWDALAKDVGDLSIDTMNGFMHRPHHHPTPTTIRVQCAEYQPFLEALDAHIEAELTKKGTSP